MRSPSWKPQPTTLQTGHPLKVHLVSENAQYHHIMMVGGYVSFLEQIDFFFGPASLGRPFVCGRWWVDLAEEHDFLKIPVAFNSIGSRPQHMAMHLQQPPLHAAAWTQSDAQDCPGGFVSRKLGLPVSGRKVDQRTEVQTNQAKGVRPTRPLLE